MPLEQARQKPTVHTANHRAAREHRAPGHIVENEHERRQHIHDLEALPEQADHEPDDLARTTRAAQSVQGIVKRSANTEPASEENSVTSGVTAAPTQGAVTRVQLSSAK